MVYTACGICLIQADATNDWRTECFLAGDQDVDLDMDLAQPLGPFCRPARLAARPATQALLKKPWIHLATNSKLRPWAYQTTASRQDFASCHG